MFFREVNLFCPYFAKFPKTPVPAKPVKSTNFPGFSVIFLWQSAAHRDKSPAVRYWTERFPYQCTSTGISRRSSKYPESGVRKTGRIIHPVIQPNKRPAQKERFRPKRNSNSFIRMPLFILKWSLLTWYQESWAWSSMNQVLSLPGWANLRPISAGRPYPQLWYLPRVSCPSNMWTQIFATGHIKAAGYGGKLSWKFCSWCFSE